MESPGSRVNVVISNSLQHKIDENKHILRQIVRAVLFLAKQGISFRGRAEDIIFPKNPGHY